MKKAYMAPIIKSEEIKIGVFGCYRGGNFSPNGGSGGGPGVNPGGDNMIGNFLLFKGWRRKGR